MQSVKVHNSQVLRAAYKIKLKTDLIRNTSFKDKESICEKLTPTEKKILINWCLLNEKAGQFFNKWQKLQVWLLRLIVYVIYLIK